MKAFRCRCGHRVFFENTHCTRCGGVLGFDPGRLQLLSLEAAYDDRLAATDGTEWRLCRNQRDYSMCNWLVPYDSAAELCSSCGLTEVIPNLASADNLRLWSLLEIAKRRLLYSLLQLGLPTGPANGVPPLRFRFLEDRRRNPDVLEAFVSTGHANGTITINVAEADDLARQELRDQMQERYRTLLGHFRHEAGHYYFQLLAPDGPVREEFRQLFGDERQPYEAALQSYYESGAPADWAQNWISAYASAHPHEDWAESFAHYLHIRDALETAAETGLLQAESSSDWVTRWMSLAVALNEINRSLGNDDPYPFVLADTVTQRLRFIDHRIGQVG